MNAKLLPYCKTIFAKWLIGFTLATSLFAFSVPTAVTNRLSQKTNIELFYLNKQQASSKSVQFGTSILNSIPQPRSAERTLYLLIADRSIAIQVYTLGRLYAMSKQKILSSSITYIFNHSGQKKHKLINA
ncbi:MAG TPA: hypothetical protein VGN20_21980 [Mucilaginibacter sp.]